ncbi:MAG: SDR family oxidoreductase [Candidatus Zixiibacteriota bacterium]|nr:MAG: SDR family oxidoreductase [candidate division Zixibacteria bacterium]
MRLIIFGATGRTGRELVRQALDQGHEVTAFARTPAKMSLQHDRLAVVRGDVTHFADVDEAMPGHDAVLSALGTNIRRPGNVQSEAVRNLAAAMEIHGVRRLIYMSSLGVGLSRGQLGPLYNYFLIPFIMKDYFKEKEKAERLIRETKLDWTIVRPGRLTNGPRTGEYRVNFTEPETSKPQISRADVADFMLQQLTDLQYLKETPGLAY